jgi:hypothetical protein
MIIKRVTPVVTYNREERRALLKASGEQIIGHVEAFLNNPNGKKMLLIRRAPGGGKTSTLAWMGDPQGGGHTWAAVFDRRNMRGAVPALGNYDEMEACNDTNCPFHAVANLLAKLGINTWSVHAKEAKMGQPCKYGQQTDCISRSMIFMAQHMRTKHPARFEAIWKDEMDLTRHITERGFTVEELRQEEIRHFTPDHEGAKFLRALRKLVDEGERQVKARLTEACERLQAEGKKKLTRSARRKMIQEIVDQLEMSSRDVFQALYKEYGSWFESWIRGLAPKGKYTNTHPFIDLDLDAEDLMESITAGNYALPPTILPIIVEEFVRELDEWQAIGDWNGFIRIGFGPKGYALYIADKLAVTPNEEGHLPPFLASDGSISADYAALLMGYREDEIEVDDFLLPVAEGTILAEVVGGPRYGKSALCTKRKDKQHPDLDRAIGDAKALLDHYDPTGEERANFRVGVISFKECVNALGDALGIAPRRRMWFWGCRGSNDLEDCTILLLIGTPALKRQDIVRYGRALYRDDAEPLRLGYEPDPDRPGRERFIDERLRRLEAYLTNTEVEQCAHRIRPIQHENRVIINLSHGKIGYLDNATIEYHQLPAMAPSGKPRKDERIEAATRRIVAAYQQLQEQGIEITVDHLQKAARVRTDLVCKWLRDQRTNQEEGIPPPSVLSVSQKTISDHYSDSGNEAIASTIVAPPPAEPTCAAARCSVEGQETAALSGHEAAECDCEQAPRKGTATTPPRYGKPCVRCGNVDHWVQVRTGSQWSWVCGCYHWWYAHPEWRGAVLQC